VGCVVGFAVFVLDDGVADLVAVVDVFGGSNLKVTVLVAYG
jgi:hypothetical protein